jgi:hypothetical protein
MCAPTRRADTQVRPYDMKSPVAQASRLWSILVGLSTAPNL